MAVRVGVPQVEVVSVDLELGCRHDPVRCGVGGIHRIDLGGVRRVLELYVHGDQTVTAQMVQVGAVIGSRNVVYGVIVVSINDIMTLRIPEIFVAVFIIANRKFSIVMVVDGEMERDFAVATKAVDVVMGVDGT